MARRLQRTEDPELKEKRRVLAQVIADHAPEVGENPTEIPGLVLFRRTSITSCYRAVYEPSLNVYAQGRKQVVLGGRTYVCGGSSFLLSSIDVPVQSQIVEATEETPLLSLLLRLDMPIVREILTTEDLPDFDTPTKGIGLAVGELTVEILDVCCRFVGLLDSPRDIPFLSRLIQREIIYRLLCSPQGERLRAIATNGDLSNRTAKAIAWLKGNYAKPLRMEELAETARMGVSTLHHQFRALTAMSPLQYQKQLRLQAARQRMLAEGMDATSAAYDVGYESVSQFNREYSRLFGQPPMRDIKALRTSASGDVAAG
jgi:AraC-like DNA-binding protein